MLIDPQVVTELRRLFLEGATPSRLVRHIAAHHEEDANWPWLVAKYFSEAFHVAVLATNLRDELADPELLRDMVGRSHLWREAVDSEPAWWDGLTVSPDDLCMIEGINPDAHPALKDVWPSLPARAQGPSDRRW